MERNFAFESVPYFCLVINYAAVFIKARRINSNKIFSFNETQPHNSIQMHFLLIISFIELYSIERHRVIKGVRMIRF